MRHEWTDAFRRGIKEIDDQHQYFIGLLNKLETAKKAKAGEKILGEIIPELIEYADLHFQTEEKYFDKFNYPDAKEHRKHHKQLRGELQSLLEAFQESFDKYYLVDDLFDFMEDWLVIHLNEMDRKFVLQARRDLGLK